MFQKLTKGVSALALALLLSPLVLTVQAHERSRRHRHRSDGSVVFVTTRHTDNGVRRRVRVRRGRNWTPGVRRGRVVVGRHDRDGRGKHRGRGHGHGRH